MLDEFDLDFTNPKSHPKHQAKWEIPINEYEDHSRTHHGGADDSTFNRAGSKWFPS